jgi:NAD(P)-dependent dehydrogenase (short-subunit alcohol dehydrogenase family)
MTNKIALVTGGTRGIGQAIANKLREEGATVVVSARNAVADLHPEHYFIAADASKPEDMARLANEVKERYGRIDILINNSGGLTSPYGGYSSISDEQWLYELQLNLMGAIRLDKALLPLMIEQGAGVIVHISSTAGMYPLVENMAYATAKSALNGYSKALSKEVAGKGVRVLRVSPGGVMTEGMQTFLSQIAAQMGVGVAEAEAGLLQKIGGVPMGRMATPEEVADLVGFLVSSKAAYITGGNYVIDGGALPVL